MKTLLSRAALVPLVAICSLSPGQTPELISAAFLSGDAASEEHPSQELLALLREMLTQNRTPPAPPPPEPCTRPEIYIG